MRNNGRHAIHILMINRLQRKMLFVSIYRSIGENPLVSIAGDAFEGLTSLDYL